MLFGLFPILRSIFDNQSTIPTTQQDAQDKPAKVLEMIQEECLGISHLKVTRCLETLYDSINALSTHERESAGLV